MANLVALGFAGSFMIETSESADDLADRLSYKYTVNMLLLYAFIVTAKSYIVGKITQNISIDNYLNKLKYLTRTKVK